ncbi:MAG: alpha/beta fold hydrolase [Pseudomonadota bacterium]
MDRETVAFAALKPLDMMLAGMVGALKATGQIQRVTDHVYRGMNLGLKAMYEKQNALLAEGLENVPAEGGLLFAINHQSWNDVQVVGASCPRRLRFLTKSEFETWPVLRHLIALSDSPYIHRGGDKEGMAAAIQSLRDGKSLAIFPEGTIPGEEDVMRSAIQPETGLLKGHTGAVRMAIAAGVPIIPVGVSGTGRSFQPEVYPRLEVLEAPKPTPITVRYGAPIRYDDYYGKECSYEDYRELTDELMRAISALVDHDRNYVPLQVPVPPLPKVERLGVLLLHGFTSSVKTVSGLAPHLEAAGIPYRMPVLRGHGGVYTDLAGCTAQDWIDDAEAALLDLSKEVDKVVVVGLSMGGLIAINLGIRRPDLVCGVCTWAASLLFRDPLTPLASVMARVVDAWPAPNAFNDLSLALESENYPRFPTDAFVSLRNFARDTGLRLGQLKVPICVMHSKADQIISPLSANVIYRDVSSSHREIHWFTRSGHEMGQDCERDKVFEETMGYLLKFKAEPAPKAQAKTQAAKKPSRRRSPSKVKV